MENFERGEKPTDMELALFLANHIKKPCEDQQGNNIRDFYIKEAERALETIQDPDAKKFLEDTIRDYSK